MNEKFPETYKGFDLISIDYIPDCSSTAIYLKHRKTGLEVYHLLNKDEENLFAFNFRTPIMNSSGAAHITEHSVFCGSEKFPLKEPFTTMMNQSVNTFLNALTYSDKTVYPSSSLIKEDYYNLMNVYGDAVFFPLLKKEAFLQEAHRYEINEEGEREIQGVVYNEMKGNYSAFEAVANDIQLRSTMPDTNYNYDSGGDPLAIPSFTYEEFRDFHHKYYRPENCLLFLYGNIDTKEQLDFIQSNFLDRLEARGFTQTEEGKALIKRFNEIETQKPFTEDRIVNAIAPEAGSTGATVSINWREGETSDLNSFIECAFLGEVLCGHDGSPMSKALFDSDLGDELAPLTGCTNDTKNFILSFGLHGVKEGDNQKVYDLILSKIQEIYENGVEDEFIQSAKMTFELVNREVNRSSGPYSLVLLERALYRWVYGETPSEGLYFRHAFDLIQKKCDDKNYIKSLIEKYILNNKNRSFVTVSPSSTYMEERDRQEKEIIEASKATISDDEIKEEMEFLHAYQNHHETESELKCIPTLDLKSFKTNKDLIPTIISDCEGLKLIESHENTNGIAYLEVLLPVDNLDPKEYPYLPLYSYCATNSGWKGMSWDKCASLTGIHTGGIGVRLFTHQAPNTEETRLLKEKYKDENFTERDWIIFTCKMIGEKVDDALSLFEDCLKYMEFTDHKQLKKLSQEAISAFKSGVIPNGNRYTSVRSQCLRTHTCSVEEIWRGISQLFSMNKIVKEKPQALGKHFEELTKELFTNGAILHVVTDDDTYKILRPKLNSFIKNVGLTPLKKQKPLDHEAFRKLMILPGQTEIGMDETFSVKSQVGYASSSMPSSFFGSELNPAELVLCHYLSGTLLWERLRTTGGSYGAYAGSANLAGLFIMSTYRDPTPHKSLEIFIDCLKEVSSSLIDEGELYRMICGTYGDEVQPASPRSRGNIGMVRTLYCVADQDLKNKIQKLLQVTPEEVQKAALNILNNIENRHNVVMSDEKTKKTGVIIKLPL